MSFKELIVPIIALALCGGTGWFLAKSKLPVKANKILGGLGFVLGLGLLLAWIFWLRPLLSDAHGVADIVFFHGKDRNILLVQNFASRTGRTHSIRLAALDAETGEELGSEVTGYGFSGDDDKLDLIHISHDKIWYHDYHNGLNAHDPYTGKTILSEQQLLEKYPQLKGNKKATATTDEGYVFEVKPPNFKLEMLAFPLGDSTWRDPSYTYVLVEDDDDEFDNEGGLKEIALDKSMGLAMKNNDHEDYDVMQIMHCIRGRYGMESCDRCINNQLNLRNATFASPFVITDPKSVLVAYDEYDGARNLKFILASINLEGKVLWEIKEATLGGKPNLFVVANGSLYLGIEGTIVAINLKDGKMKWTTQL